MDPTWDDPSPFGTAAADLGRTLLYATVARRGSDFGPPPSALAADPFLAAGTARHALCVELAGDDLYASWAWDSHHSAPNVTLDAVAVTERVDRWTGDPDSDPELGGFYRERDTTMDQLVVVAVSGGHPFDVAVFNTRMRDWGAAPCLHLFARMWLAYPAVPGTDCWLSVTTAGIAEYLNTRVGNVAVVAHLTALPDRAVLATAADLYRPGSNLVGDDLFAVAEALRTGP